MLKIQKQAENGRETNRLMLSDLLSDGKSSNKAIALAIAFM